MIDLARSRVPLVIVPVLAVLALALGLRIGAKGDFNAAIVEAAPPAKGSTSLRWQVMTVKDERNVEETLSMTITVTASSQGRSSVVTTTTNGDGIAEITLDVGAHMGDSVDLRVADAAGAILAQGSTVLQAPPRVAPQRQFVRPSKREGRVGIDLALRGGRLAPGHAGEGWVRIGDTVTHRALGDGVLTLTPEMGLFAKVDGLPCGAGWTKVELVPTAHVVGLTIDARSHVDTGTWFGSLPIAPGALVVEVPDEVPVGPLSFDVVAPGAQSVAYVEVDDDEGRLYAGALPLAAESTAPLAHVTTTPLTEGRYWIVVSGEPKGAMTMTGATMAIPVHVGAPTACPGSDDVGWVASGFPRWVAVDGRVGATMHAATRHARGLALALGSLAVAAVLETLLIVLGAQRASEDLARLAEEAETPSLGPSRKLGVIDVAVALLLLALCLGLLATFVTWRFQ